MKNSTSFYLWAPVLFVAIFAVVVGPDIAPTIGGILNKNDNSRFVAQVANSIETLVGRSVTTTFRDTGLTPQTRYTYSVEAYDVAGNVSARSNPITVFTVVPPPSTGPVLTPSSTLPPCSSGTPQSCPRTLSFGSTGEDVRRLQEFFIAKNYLPPGSDIGVFGPLTERAVKRFQSLFGIVSYGTPNTTGYGMVGPITVRKIIEQGGSVYGIAGTVPAVATTPAIPTATTGGVVLTKTLYFGIRDSEVLLLQTFLFSKGYLTADSVTGYFGPITRAAVQKYQCTRGIVCSGNEITTGYGMVGKITRGKLRGE